MAASVARFTKFSAWIAVCGIASLNLSLFSTRALAQASLDTEQSSGEGSGQSTAVGQSATANIVTGDANLSVPIQLPPGRGQATPALGLVYSSSASEGPFGVGWNMGLGAIVRSTKNGVPSCAEDHEFTLSLPGATVELVRKSGTSTYYAEVDKAFVEAVADTASNTWVVHDRAGRTYRFGGDWTGSARSWSGGDVFMDPIGCRFTAMWALTQIEDPNGNMIDFEYVNRIDNGADVWYVFPYISEIRYGANPGAGLTAHPFKVTFRRRPRIYRQESWNLGVSHRLDDLIDQIQVLYRKSLSDTTYYVDRTYTLSYKQTVYGGRAYLERIDNDAGLPSRTFGYAGPETNTAVTETRPHPFAPFGPWGNAISFGGGGNIVHTDALFVDMNGDGYVDAVNGGGTSTWAVQLGGPTGFGPTTIQWDVSKLIEISQPGEGSWKSPSQVLIQWTLDRRRDTIIDLVDLTGDGILDWVYAWETPWKVFPGRCTSATQCKFDDYISWRAPGPYTSVTKPDFLGTQASYTYQALIDMNGDGYLDLVNTFSGWTVWFGSPTGFAATGVAWPGATGHIARSIVNAQGDREVWITRRVFDFNGDGLPDYVTGGPSWDTGGAHNTLEVRLNTGSGFSTTPIQSWPGAFPHLTRTRHTACGNNQVCLNATDWDFFDVNGDGLPDLVFTPLSGNGQAALNVGGGKIDPAGFREIPVNPVTAQMGGFRFRASNTNTSGGYTFTVEWQTADVMDLNGDGLMEFVRLDGSTLTAMRAAPSGDTARAGLLVAADDGARGLTGFQYTPSTRFDNAGSDGVPDLPFPLWVTTAIRQTDGLCSLIPTNPFDPSNPCLVAGHERLRRYAYQDGLYDAADREFRGFGVVTEIDSNGNETETFFSQADYTRGRILKQVVRAVGASQSYDLRIVENDWRVNTGVLDPGRTQVYLAQTRTEERGVPDTAGTRMCSVSRNNSPDAYGRGQHSCTYECGTEPSDPLTSCLSPLVPGETISEVFWANPISGSYVRERPSNINSYYVRPDGTSATLSLKRTRYDGTPGGNPLALGSVDKGNVRRVASYLDQSTIGQATGYLYIQMEYDGYGNLVSTRDERDNTTQSVYDNNYFALHPVQRSAPTAGGVSHITQLVTNLRFGKPTSVTDVNGQTTSFAYDALGRLICEARPGDSLSNCHLGGPVSATREIYYSFADPAAGNFEGKHSRIEVRVPNAASPTGYNSVIAYSDAFGRKRFRRVERTIGTASPTSFSFVVEGQVDYDSESRPIVQYAPYLAPADETPSAPTTRLSYQLNNTSLVDPLGRVHALDPPDQQLFVSTYLGRRTEVRDARNAVRVELRDHLGRTVRRESHDTGGAVITTSYTYDGANRVLTQQTSDNPSTTISTVYDTLGRKISGTNPNSNGSWKYAYDSAGNLIYEDDPEPLQHVQIAYDELNRIVRRCTYNTTDAYDATVSATSCGTGTTESSYAYGEAFRNGVGKLTTATDAHGSEQFWYDTRGRVETQRRTIEGISADTDFTYDSADRLKSVTYPDGDIRDYGYNAAGQLISLVGVVLDIDYDLWGAATAIVRANGTTDSRTYYGGEENFRLRDLQTFVSSNPATKYLDLSYGYNNLGKVETVTDRRDPVSNPLSNSAQYVYDGIGRLGQVTGSNFNETFGFDPRGNLTARSGKTLAYSATRPHQVESFGAASITYTANGNRKQKSEPAVEVETYTYNALDQLTQITVDADLVTFGYDYTGRRIWKRTNNAKQIRYFNRFAESEQGGVLTKHYWAGDVLIASNHVSAPQFSSAEGRYFIPIEWLIGFWGLVITLLVGAGLQLRPVRLRLPHGAVAARSLGAVLLILVTGPAILLFPDPAAACGGGGGPSIPYSGMRNYHTDHLGSTQVVTGGGSGLWELIRYDAYGAVRLRQDWNGNNISGSNHARREFTGYEAEHVSGLQYAGARFYDAELGQFLIHDPAGQFPSPYAYGPGDPMNGTDPTGAIFGIEWAIISAVLAYVSLAVTGISHVYSTVAAYKAGGSEAAMKTWGISIGISVAGAAAGGAIGAAGYNLGPLVGGFLGPVAEVASNAGVQATFQIASIGLSITSMAMGDSAPAGLAYASYALAGAALGMAFASYAAWGAANAANGIQPAQAKPNSDVELASGDAKGRTVELQRGQEHVELFEPNQKVEIELSNPRLPNRPMGDAEARLSMRQGAYDIETGKIRPVGDVVELESHRLSWGGSKSISIELGKGSGFGSVFVLRAEGVWGSTQLRFTGERYTPGIGI